MKDRLEIRCSEAMEGDIKTLLKQIKTKRTRPKPSQADILLEALELLNAQKGKKFDTPKHETISEWENRTGESYPDEAPVWLNEKEAVKNGEWIGWSLKVYEQVKGKSPEYWKVIIANHHGKPKG